MRHDHIKAFISKFRKEKFPPFRIAPEERAIVGIERIYVVII
jgi:hypothetical protein